jgi:hypothetical protein
MKNVLIPTTLKPDTVDALKTVARNSHNGNVKVVLLMLSEMPDGITDLLFSTKSGIESELENVKTLRECKAYANAFENIDLHVHHQYGISGPLMRNIMEHHEIGLVIMTPSYKQEKESIHQHAVKIVNNGKCPVLHLPEKVKELSLDQAIYLEDTPSHISISEVQQMLKRDFDIQVVRQAKVNNGHTLEELSPVLNESITEDRIPLVVETRKPDKKWSAGRKKAQVNLAEKLGVPVLSILEN